MNFVKNFYQLKGFDDIIGELMFKIEDIQIKSNQNEFSFNEDYKKQLDHLISQKTDFLLEDYNSLAKFAAKLEDNLKFEFDGKISKILKEIGHETFMKSLKENSGEFETKLKSTFEDLNGRIKTSEEKIQNFQKRKEEIFWSVKTDFERKFKEGESYFMNQLNVFKNMLNTKIESKDFKNLMDDIMETKVLELRSELYVHKNSLATQLEEIKIIKEESQLSLDNINSEVKDSLNNVTSKINQMEDLQNSDRNDMTLLEEKLNEMQGNIEKFKQNFAFLQKETEQKFLKENEIKVKDINDIKEISNKMKEKEKKTEQFIVDLKKDSQFSKINQLEMVLTELSSNLQKNQGESKILLESLKTKVNILTVENNRLKERENVLLSELEDNNKKHKMMFSLEQRYNNNNESTNSFKNNNFN